MGLVAVGFEGLEIAASEGYPHQGQARPCHEKGHHRCLRTESLCLNDLHHFILPDIWLRHPPRTHLTAKPEWDLNLKRCTGLVVL